MKRNTMRKASLTIIAWALLLFARTAQAQLIDNGNGTVSDGKTGLMWEKKTPAATGGVHNVEERYTWSVAARAGQMQPDGTVFTLFGKPQWQEVDRLLRKSL